MRHKNEMISAGSMFVRLTVIDFVGIKDGLRQYRCLCECGNEVKVPGTRLRSGNTRSCGCLKRELASARFLKHGHNRDNSKRSPTYQSWTAMIARCSQSGHKDWHRYGGRGIKVCERWLIFDNFLVDMGERPENKTVDRVDSDGDYEPGNCRWADSFTQARHHQKLSDDQVREIRRDTRSLRVISEEYGVTPVTISHIRIGRQRRNVI